MAFTHEIDEQIQLERDAIAQGLANLRKNTDRLERSAYASATVYGIATIDTLLPLVVEEIEKTVDRIHTRQNGVAFKEISTHLAELEPLAAAAITCKVTMDKVFAKTTDENRQPNGLAKVTEAIGQAVEDELQMRHYEREAPGLLHTIKENYWHRSCGTKQKLTVVQTLMNRHEVTPWSNWGSKLRVKLGGWLAGLPMQCLRVVHHCQGQVGQQDTSNCCSYKRVPVH